MKTAKMLFILVAALSFGLSAFAQTLAERPEVVRGVSWKYHFVDTQFPGVPASDYSYTIKVKGVAPDGIIAERVGEDGSIKPTSLDYDLNFVMKDQGYTYKVFPFPLVRGKTWKFEYDSNNGAGTKWKNKVTGEVIGTERVVVLAGTFETTKVVLKRTYWGTDGTSRWSGEVIDTWWYAPAVRNFVKRIVSDSNVAGGAKPTVQELVAYNPATTTLTAESSAEEAQQ